MPAIGAVGGALQAMFDFKTAAHGEGAPPEFQQSGGVLGMNDVDSGGGTAGATFAAVFEGVTIAEDDLTAGVGGPDELGHGIGEIAELGFVGLGLAFAANAQLMLGTLAQSAPDGRSKAIQAVL